MATGSHKMLVVALVVAATAWPALARGPQGGRGEAPGPKGQGPKWDKAEGGDVHHRLLQRMVHRLDLTDQQQETIKGILEEGRSEAKEAGEALARARKTLQETVAAGADEQAIRTAAAAVGTAIGEKSVLHARNMSRIREVLTDEQKDQFDQMRQNIGQRREHTGRGQGAGRERGQGQRMRRPDRGGPEGPGGRRSGFGPGPGRRVNMVDRLLEEADTNEDGALSAEELDAYKEKMAD